MYFSVLNSCLLIQLFSILDYVSTSYTLISIIVAKQTVSSLEFALMFYMYVQRFTETECSGDFSMPL